MRRTAFMCVFALAGTAAQGGWADRLFAESAHDFGPVPRGAKVRHSFVLNNRTAEAITILDVRASCGCTSGRASASVVPAGRQATVEAEMDTRNFVGKKATTLTVSMVSASGREAEARLGVSSDILADIVLNPGSADFGAVARGGSPSLAIAIDRLGGPDWRAVRMVSDCKYLSAKLEETGRSAKGVGYRLTVSLKADAPAGDLREEIRILTNDPASPNVPVLVTASVRGELTASPALLSLGNVAKSGAQGRYLIRGSRPFAITAIEGAGEGFSIAEADAGPKVVHVLTLKYDPARGSMRGDLRRSFRVRTDAAGEPPLVLNAALHVDP